MLVPEEVWMVELAVMLVELAVILVELSCATDDDHCAATEREEPDEDHEVAIEEEEETLGEGDVVTADEAGTAEDVCIKEDHEFVTAGEVILTAATVVEVSQSSLVVLVEGVAGQIFQRMQLQYSIVPKIRPRVRFSTTRFATAEAAAIAVVVIRIVLWRVTVWLRVTPLGPDWTAGAAEI